MATALYVGRFQPFHLGHLKVIQEILKVHPFVVIGIGSAQGKNTKENPFSAAERIKMIELALAEAGIGQASFSFVKIPDVFNDVRWIEKTLKLAGNFDVAYTNNELTKYCFQFKGIKTRGTQYFAPYKAEFIRKRIAKGKPWEDYVPKAVHDYIIKIKGNSRIKRLAKKKYS